ncbi:protein dehydratase [Sphingomonas sp. CL5.1]|uniref:FAS1-like dehydratase domain-containing protein n=1 Tax=Sphingomonas sp. CL5.1 TaxID=2653203 RepID=UPI001581E1D8|nr:MaoC family dehydratase N-terminal domain-containing protein [Sphingomonas sp. CL5.1]QKS00236.1 protein dehydratase [Sphingomonas sp. CL5.1]
MSGELDIDHLRQWIGREEASQDVLTAALAARFHATLDLPGAAATQSEVAPALIHFCLCQPAAAMHELGGDGHPATGGFLPPVLLPRRMWASSAIDFHKGLRVGDVVAKRSRVAEVTTKSGRSGNLCFVTVEHEIRAHDRLAISERQTIVYREAAGSRASVAPMPETAPQGVTVETITASASLLFRYSAVTFNGHRIHYDLPYAMGEEHYPGLVVHGPLQATLLVHLAARCNGGRAPDHFSFRGVQPAIGGEALSLNAGALIDNSMELWSARPGGALAMRATAQWR